VLLDGSVVHALLLVRGGLGGGGVWPQVLPLRYAGAGGEFIRCMGNCAVQLRDTIGLLGSFEVGGQREGCAVFVSI
jgi:hypothetical protein